MCTIIFYSISGVAAWHIMRRFFAIINSYYLLLNFITIRYKFLSLFYLNSLYPTKFGGEKSLDMFFRRNFLSKSLIP
jgi:hypothetical protein